MSFVSDEQIRAAVHSSGLDALPGLAARLDVRRIGTVHAFQGNERDTILASMAVGPDESAGTWRFVEDPHLFTVLVTRSRKHLQIVLSAEPPAGGLVVDYLVEADSPRGCPKPVRPLDPWSDELATFLETADLPIARSYPSGRHIVDVCVGNRWRAFSIECTIHPDGPGAHVDRHLALRRAGWEFLEAYQSKWGDRQGELVVELVQQLKSTK